MLFDRSLEGAAMWLGQDMVISLNCGCSRRSAQRQKTGERMRALMFVSGLQRGRIEIIRTCRAGLCLALAANVALSANAAAEMLVAVDSTIPSRDQLDSSLASPAAPQLANGPQPAPAA